LFSAEGDFMFRLLVRNRQRFSQLQRRGETFRDLLASLGVIVAGGVMVLEGLEAVANAISPPPEETPAKSEENPAKSDED
jgi:hypothetical protein